MRAILIGNRLYPETFRHRSESERLLPPLLDRPFVQHVIESMVEAGADEIDVILSQASGLVQDLLGNGNRWGVALRYHQIPPGASPYEAISTLDIGGHRESSILLAQADVLPKLEADAMIGHRAPLFFCWRDGVPRWTGWALLRGDDLEGLRLAFNPKEAFDKCRSESRSTAGFSHSVIEDVPKPLMAGTYQDLIEAHLRVLHGQHPGLLLIGREIAPGVRVSRNVTIHRTAKLAGPAFIGENCRISEHCHIGQGASIGRDCVIENRTIVESSVLCPGSYVGEGLELRQVYVDRGWLVNTRLRAEIDNVDECLLGSVYPSPRRLAKKTVSWIR